jgi:hypothetical protein
MEKEKVALLSLPVVVVVSRDLIPSQRHWM